MSSVKILSYMHLGFDTLVSHDRHIGKIKIIMSQDKADESLSVVSSTDDSNGGRKNGIDNPGFHDEEKSVNFELVDLNQPNNQQPDKTPTAFSDYFIPVNQHKKGIRGEKLYVTKDSRQHRSLKRYGFASLAFALLIIAIVVASLVGAGILEPDSKGQKEGRSRDFPVDNGTVLSTASTGTSSITTTTTTKKKNKTLESDNYGKFVPNALEGSLKIENSAWNEKLSNKSDPVFREFADKFVQAITPSIIPDRLRDEAEFLVTVVDFKQGSVIVTYRVSWTMKNKEMDGTSLLEDDEVVDSLKKELSSNNGRLFGLFQVRPESISLQHVPIDRCELKNCQFHCFYNYSLNDFACSCPLGYNLQTDGKTCTEQQEHTADNTDHFTSEIYPMDDGSSSTHLFTTISDVQEITTEDIKDTFQSTSNIDYTPSSTWPTLHYETIVRGTTSEATTTPLSSQESNEVTTEESEIYNNQSEVNTDGFENQEITIVNEEENNNFTIDQEVSLSQDPSVITTQQPAIITEKSTNENSEVPITIIEGEEVPVITTLKYEEIVPFIITTEQDNTSDVVKEINVSDNFTELQITGEHETTTPQDRKLAVNIISEETTIIPPINTVGREENNPNKTDDEEEKVSITTISNNNVFVNEYEEVTGIPSVSSETPSGKETTTTILNVRGESPKEYFPIEITTQRKESSSPIVEVLEEFLEESNETISTSTVSNLNFTEQVLAENDISTPFQNTNEEEKIIKEVFTTPTPIITYFVEEKTTMSNMEVLNTQSSEPVKEETIVETTQASETLNKEILTTTQSSESVKEEVIVETTQPTEFRQEDVIVATTQPSEFVKEDIIVTTTLSSDVREDVIVTTQSSESVKENVIVTTTQSSESVKEDIVDTTTQSSESAKEDIVVTTTQSSESAKEDVTVTTTQSLESANEDVIVTTTQSLESAKKDVIAVTTQSSESANEDAIVTTQSLESEKEDGVVTTTQPSESVEENIIVKTTQPSEKVLVETTLSSESLNDEVPVETTQPSESVKEEAFVKTTQPSEKVLVETTQSSESLNDEVPVETTQASESVKEGTFVKTTQPSIETTTEIVVTTTTIKTLEKVQPVTSLKSNQDESEITTIKNEELVHTTNPLMESRTTQFPIQTNSIWSLESTESSNHKVVFPTESSSIDNANELRSQILENSTFTSSNETFKDDDDVIEVTTLDSKNHVVNHTSDETVETTTTVTITTTLLDVLTGEVKQELSKCKENEFYCEEDGSCISKSSTCDGTNDCSDGSDELNCDRSCSGHQCLNGPCIDSKLLCDGRSDCPYKDDEMNCTSSAEECIDDPDARTFFCVKDRRCIESSARCDGIVDCVNDNADERDCDCSQDEFKCELGGGCIPKTQRCDGSEQCPDQSDEWDCLRLVDEYFQVLVNDSWTTLCLSNGTEWATASCQQMGFFNAEVNFNNQNENRNEKFVIMVGNPENRTSLAQGSHAKETIINCPLNPKVSCFNYDCGNWSLTDELKQRLSNGNEVELDGMEQDQWPSVAYLFNVNNKTSCTASIVSPKWLITPRSCLVETSLEPTHWVVFGGPSGQNVETQIKIVKRIIQHPLSRFLQGRYSNDLALIEITEPFFFNNIVNAACLAEKSISEDDFCIQAGWLNVDMTDDVTFRQYLKKINVSECEEDGNFLCGSEDSKVDCNNDSGAPLLCLDSKNQTWRLHGVLTRGCNQKYQQQSQKMDLYASVQIWERWIKKTIGN